MRLRQAAYCGAFWLLSVKCVLADPNNASIHLGPLPKPNSAAASAQFGAMLIGGKEADPKDWPASVYSSQGNSRCTATIVGPRTLFIAAHCVGNGHQATFSAGGGSYRSTCTHSPDYDMDATADWALCLIDSEVKNVPYEHIATDPQTVAVGDSLMLTGYGCTQPGGGGGNDGTYRIGEAKVSEIPGSSNDIITKGGAALCFGDSGGPAFKILPDGKRLQVSINSRGDIKTTSYLSAVYTPKAKQFIAQWKQQNGQKICGLDVDTQGCRSTEPPGPKPLPLPQHCRVNLTKFTNCLYGTPKRDALKDPAACQLAYASLLSCEEIAEKTEDPK